MASRTQAELREFGRLWCDPTIADELVKAAKRFARGTPEGWDDFLQRVAERILERDAPIPGRDAIVLEALKIMRHIRGTLTGSADFRRVDREAAIDPDRAPDSERSRPEGAALIEERKRQIFALAEDELPTGKYHAAALAALRRIAKDEEPELAGMAAKDRDNINRLVRDALRAAMDRTDKRKS